MIVHRRQFLRESVSAGGGLMVTAAMVPAAASQPNDGTVNLRIIDRAARHPVPARVRLLDAAGREIVPLGHPQTLPERGQEGDVGFFSRRFAYVDGQFSVDPRQLPLRYQVLKGYEYQMVEGSLDPAAVGRGPIAIPIERWSSLSKQGWYGGDVHIHHIAPRTCRLEMDAEDLSVANILTSDFTKDQQEFEGRLNANSSDERLIYVNQEFRNEELGHINLLNLKKLVQPVKPRHPHHHPLLMRAMDETHAQGGYVAWAHFPSWPGAESPLDVSMGKLDGLELLCVLEPRELPIFMKQVVPEIDSNNGLRLWYRYLNCGFRLSASAGTDKMTNRVTVGANRVYARVNGPFTYQSWIDALKAGRTCVTNSPLLSFSVDGNEPGATIEVDSRRRKAIEVRASCESQLPYHRLEIVCNGNVIADATPGGPLHRASIHVEHPLYQSCWLAARALEDIDEYRRRGTPFSVVHAPEGTLHGQYFGTRRPETVFAHASPVYVIRDGVPIRSWDDAQYYVRYLEASLRWLKTDARFASRSDRQASIRSFEGGRKIYERLAREARSRESTRKSVVKPASGWA